MKVIAGYNYFIVIFISRCNVIDYIASENEDYNYLRSCNRLQSITITDYDNPNPDMKVVHLDVFAPLNDAIILQQITKNTEYIEVKLYYKNYTIAKHVTDLKWTNNGATVLVNTGLSQ